jgi:transcription elongation GreA/GreB family factor
VIKDLQVGMGMGVIFLYQDSENVESYHAVASLC